MDFKYYKGKTILSWLYYNPRYADFNGSINNVCYVYPRVLYTGTSYEMIDPDDFPNYGRIEVRVQGGDTSEDVYSLFGSLVTIRINGEPYPNIEANNRYSLKYNSNYGKVSSEIWIESFSGKGFYQIIDVNNDISSIQYEQSIPEPSFPIRTTLILLKYEDKLYGPFEYDTKEGTTILRGVKDNQYIVGEYEVSDFLDQLLTINDQDGNEAITLLPRNLIVSPEKCIKNHDWISEETLIDNFVDSLRIDNNYTRDQIRQIKEIMHQYIETNSDEKFSNNRIEKIKTLFQKILQNEEYTHSLIQYALNDEKIKNNIVEDVAKNHFEQIQDKISDITTIQQFINDLKAEELSLTQHIEELKQKEVDYEKKETSVESQQKIDELEELINSLREENSNLVERIEIQKEIEELKTECTKLKNERDRARDNYNQQLIDNKELKDQFEETLQEFNSRAKQTARILDNKLLNQILRGVEEENSNEEFKFNPSLLHESLSCSEIINRVGTYIREKAHRNVTNNEVANYLICITQGFITTFAGEPGTGKTSLCNIIAKSLGLVVPHPQNRFIEISVERGWNSHKDFIGYYNPLTKSMEKSNLEVFNAFLKLNSECGNNNDPYNPSSIALFLILLDEANLSPIEHYWATFLKNCDFNSSSSRVFSLGGSNNFSIPNHLRFLATVNFDHTTEELSPRFLDRSWVITLEPTRINDEFEEELENYEDMISFESLQSAFSSNEDDVIDEAILKKWNDIQAIFRSEACSLPIMPRNLKMVKNYCAVACKCMDRDTPSTKFAPLDYAFSQKILPTINGTGENYRRLINELLKECTEQNMPISARHLKRMQKVAENNMGFYQFFGR